MVRTKIKLDIADALEYNERAENSNPYDESCKKVLSNKQILAWIIKACMIEFEKIPLHKIVKYIDSDPVINVKMDYIQGLNTEDITVNGARIYFDIVVNIRMPYSLKKENIGLILNLEAQGSDSKPYSLLSRAIYYVSRLLARQKNRQDGFMNSDYQNLKKVYSIWIVMNTSKEKEGVFNRYSLKEECLKKEYHFPTKDYDKLAIVMIYPKSVYDESDSEYDVMKLLTLLFKTKQTAEEKKYQLEKNYAIMMTREIEAEMNHMCNLSEVWLDEGRNEGLALGLEKGRKEMAGYVMNLMNSMNLTAIEVMNMMGIDRELQPEINKFITDKKQ